MAKYTYRLENIGFVFYEDGKNIDLVALKEEFQDDHKEFECKIFGCNPEDKANIRHRKRTSDTINTFAFYLPLSDWVN
jgi:hypothetical protein